MKLRRNFLSAYAVATGHRSSAGASDFARRFFAAWRWPSRVIFNACRRDADITPPRRPYHTYDDYATGRRCHAGDGQAASVAAITPPPLLSQLFHALAPSSLHAAAHTPLAFPRASASASWARKIILRAPLIFRAANTRATNTTSKYWLSKFEGASPRSPLRRRRSPRHRRCRLYRPSIAYRLSHAAAPPRARHAAAPSARAAYFGLPSFPISGQQPRAMPLPRPPCARAAATWRPRWHAIVEGSISGMPSLRWAGRATYYRNSAHVARRRRHSPGT